MAVVVLVVVRAVIVGAGGKGDQLWKLLNIKRRNEVKGDLGHLTEHPN
jgi:hypothetical protein